MKQNPMIRRLLAVLSRLSAPAADQVRYLESLGTAPSADELALELDDVFPAVKHELPADLQLAIVGVESQLRAMTRESPDLWTTSALSAAPEWGEVRRLARIGAEELTQLLNSTP